MAVANVIGFTVVWLWFAGRELLDLTTSTTETRRLPSASSGSSVAVSSQPPEN
jgi:hypothetical protein